jgi:hypothetical protein
MSPCDLSVPDDWFAKPASSHYALRLGTVTSGTLYHIGSVALRCATRMYARSLFEHNNRQMYVLMELRADSTGAKDVRMILWKCHN